MDRTELTLAVAGALLLAAALGWTLAAIAGRLNLHRGGPLAARLRAAEAGRALAEARLAEVEMDYGVRLAEAEAALAAARLRLAEAANAGRATEAAGGGR